MKGKDSWHCKSAEELFNLFWYRHHFPWEGSRTCHRLQLVFSTVDLTQSGKGSSLAINSMFYSSQNSLKLQIKMPVCALLTTLRTTSIANKGAFCIAIRLPLFRENEFSSVFISLIAFTALQSITRLRFTLCKSQSVNQKWAIRFLLRSPKQIVWTVDLYELDLSHVN